MNFNAGLPLVAPRITPVLDPAFRPAALANRAFRDAVLASKAPVPVRLALEQTEGNVSHLYTQILPPDHPLAAGNFIFLERLLKFLLWSRGGGRIYFDGPALLAAKLAEYYHETAAGKFDSEVVGERMFDRPLEIVHSTRIPAEQKSATALGVTLMAAASGLTWVAVTARWPR